MGVGYGPKAVSGVNDGSSSDKAAISAIAIKQLNPSAADGTYWIDLPNIGATEVYCLMDSRWAGGGWMLAMKATTGTTFNYSANYWTTNNTLNPTDLTRNNADAKYEVMNQFLAKDLLALWPTLSTASSNGSIASTGTYTWLQTNFNNSKRQNLISFFTQPSGLTFTSNAGGSGYFITRAKTFSGYANGIFSAQPDIQFYGFNYRANQNTAAGFAVSANVRWGFGWNENSEGIYPSTDVGQYRGSNDVSGGIGMDTGFKSYSAGDVINCCQEVTGANTSLRVEVYVR